MLLKKCVSTVTATLSTLLMVMALMPSVVHAQANAAIAVGAGIDVYRPTSTEAEEFVAVSFLYRVMPERSGWRPIVGFNWYSIKMRIDTAGVRHPFGTLRLRPVMAGYSYTHRMGTLALSASALGGYSFNRFRLDDRARVAYRDHLGVLLLDSGAANRPVFKTELALWHNVSDRVGLVVSVAGIRARTDLTPVTDSGRRRLGMRADAVKVLIGAAYGLF